MEYRLLNETIKYDGTQLKSHWIFERTKIIGDAIVAFLGPADVSLKNMVDLADVAAKAKIASPEMLHFIVEHFDMSLSAVIIGQRLLCAIASEELTRRIGKPIIERRGDDLYDGDRKLSVSIATRSPMSALIHFGINIRCEGTPVPTKGLADYNIDPSGFAGAVMQRYADEMKSLKTARCKVRAVS